MAQNRIYDLFASAARTATPAAVTLREHETSGLLLVIDLTAFAVAADLRPVITVPGVGDTNFAELYRAALANAVTAVGTFMYYFYPQGLESANAESTNMKDRVAISIPAKCSITIAHANANSHTYSVRAYGLA